MTLQKVLLLGATGQTGGSILDGLLEDGGFDVAALVRPASLEKPEVKALKERGVPIIATDSTADVAVLTESLRGFDTVVSTIDASSQLAQRNLVDAAAAAGIKRFIPCGWTTISPPGGIMLLRDQKEEIHSLIFRHHLPYTIIDVGYWHILSFPNLPSGRVDYASFFGPKTTIFGDGNAPTLLTHLPDIGRFVARILKDPRTLNKRVVTWSDELSQNQIIEMMEDVSGEKIERKFQSEEEFNAQLSAAREAYDSSDKSKSWSPEFMKLVPLQYTSSKFFRSDNTLANAKYLGYLDARELYPDLKPVTFKEFLTDELLQGKSSKPYPNLQLPK